MRTYLASNGNTYRARTPEGAARQAYGRRNFNVLPHPKFADFWEVSSPDFSQFVGDITVWEN